MNRRLAFILLLLVFGTCREPIDLDVDRVRGQLVVYGHVDNGDDALYVQVSRTNELPYQYLPEVGATVTLMDNQGNTGVYRRTQEDGIFLYDRSSMRIIPGRTYRLRVRTANGTVYESDPEQIPLNRAIPQATVEFKQVLVNTGSAGSVTTINVMDIYATTVLASPSSDYFIRWRSFQTFRFNPTDFPDPFSSVPPPCYINREIQPQRIPVFSTAGFQGDQIPRRLMGRIEIDYAFNNKNVITVKAFSQTREAYDFYRKAGIVLNNTGSIFDIPAAAIPGNFHNVEDPEEEVLGYFDASLVEIQRIEVTRLDFPYRVPETDCMYESSRPVEQYPQRCLNCTTIEGSSYSRPYFY